MFPLFGWGAAIKQVICVLCINKITNIVRDALVTSN